MQDANPKTKKVSLLFWLKKSPAQNITVCNTMRQIQATQRNTYENRQGRKTVQLSWFLVLIQCFELVDFLVLFIMNFTVS